MNNETAILENLRFQYSVVVTIVDIYALKKCGRQKAIDIRIRDIRGRAHRRHKLDRAECMRSNVYLLRGQNGKQMVHTIRPAASQRKRPAFHQVRGFSRGIEQGRIDAGIEQQ